VTFAANSLFESVSFFSNVRFGRTPATSRMERTA